MRYRSDSLKLRATRTVNANNLKYDEFNNSLNERHPITPLLGSCPQRKRFVRASIPTRKRSGLLPAGRASRYSLAFGNSGVLYDPGSGDDGAARSARQSVSGVRDVCLSEIFLRAVGILIGQQV